VVGKVLFLTSILTCRVDLLAALNALSAEMCSPRGLPPACLPLPCSPAARPLRAGALSAKEGGVRLSRRRRRCRQPATESAPGVTLTCLSHRPSAPRFTSGANRAARPATRSHGSLLVGYPCPSTRSAPPPVRPRTPCLSLSRSGGRLRSRPWLSHRRPCRPPDASQPVDAGYGGLT